jgi:hypothetical protein
MKLHLRRGSADTQNKWSLLPLPTFFETRRIRRWMMILMMNEYFKTIIMNVLALSTTRNTLLSTNITISWTITGTLGFNLSAPLQSDFVLYAIADHWRRVDKHRLLLSIIINGAKLYRRICRLKKSCLQNISHEGDICRKLEEGES